MEEHELNQELYKACFARSPEELMFSTELDEEIEILQEYLGRKFNNLQVDNDLVNKVKDIGYSNKLGFDKWFSERIDFYENK